MSLRFRFWCAYLKRLLKFKVSAFSLFMSTLFQSCMSLGTAFLGLRDSLLSIVTASWSLTPEITDVLLIRLMKLEKNKSKVLVPLVGS